MKTALLITMEARAKYLEVAPHKPKERRPHLAQEFLQRAVHRHDAEEIVRPCFAHVRRLAKGERLV